MWPPVKKPTCGAFVIGLVLAIVVSTSMAAGLPGTIKCRPGDNPSPCLVDPCGVLPCTLKPWQKCYSNYCNKPVWFLGTVVKGPCAAVVVDKNTKKVVPTCPLPGLPGTIKCRPGDNPSPCLVDPCGVLPCTLKPWQKCYSNYCNKPVWFLGTVVKGPCAAVIVDKNTKKVVPTCPLPGPIKCHHGRVACLVDPCKDIQKKCVLDKGVVCVPNYCNGPVTYYGQLIKGQPCSPVLINRNTLKIVKCKAPVPEVCYELYKPVCGVDGKTYGNDCFLAQARVKKAYNGKCKCDVTLYKPVCGADRKTYATACKAKQAGVGYTDGACVTRPCNALCSLNVDCAKSTSHCKGNPKFRCQVNSCAKQHLTSSGKPVEIPECSIVYFSKLTGYINTNCTV